MHAIRHVIGGAVVALMFAATATAAPFTLAGGTEGVVSGGAGGNDFAGTMFPGLQIGGFFGSQILFNMPAGTAVRVDFLGAEAGFEDGFGFSNAQFIHTGGVEMAATMAAPLSSVMVSAAGPGLLPFVFQINQNAAHILNGSNPNGSSAGFKGPNFFATCNPFISVAGAGGTDCNSVFLFLDDGGGGADGDHDDLVVRLTAVGGIAPSPELNTVENPEPATLTLLGLGFLLSVRRFRRQ